LPFYYDESDQLFGHKDWGFQQDGASSHTDGKVQKWCANNFKLFIPKNRWPPSSPELNPLDYSIWNNMPHRVEYGKVKNMNDLRREVEKAMKKVELHYVRDVIGVFLRRVRSVEKHDGELIFDEHS